MARAKINGSGWHSQSVRHSNAKRFGKAGGNYALNKYQPTSIKIKNNDATKYKELQEIKSRKQLIKEGKEPFLNWFEEIPEEEIQRRIEENKEYAETDITSDKRKQIINQIYQDSDYWQSEWDNLTEYLNEQIDQKTKGLKNNEYWHVEVKNFGWRNQDGQKIIKAKDAQELLQKTLPDTDNHFKIYNYGKRGIKIQNYHHDSPTGNEWYYITPATQKEIKQERGY